MNYVDLVFSVILLLLSLWVTYFAIVEHELKLSICFILVAIVSADYSIKEFKEAYNKINPPCELAQGCVKKEVSV